MENDSQYIKELYIPHPPPPGLYTLFIYGKSGCVRCDELKEMLDFGKIEYTYINCDEYLSIEKEKFKEVMFEYMKITPIKKILYFPVCFVNGVYFSSINKFLYNA
jgi:hypothetical protein